MKTLLALFLGTCIGMLLTYPMMNYGQGSVAEPPHVLSPVPATQPTHTHPYSRSRTPLPYERSPDQCYQRPATNSTTAAVVLLPDKFQHMPAMQGGGLARLLANTPADVIVFHTGWDEANLQALQAAVSLPFTAMCVANTDWEDGHYAFSWEYVQEGFHGPGYRSMCLWYSKRVFRVLAGMGYQWVIRLDTDSDLPFPVQYNLVSAMESRNARYGLRVTAAEQPDVTIGLPEAAQYWVVAQSIKPEDMWILNHCNPPSISGIPNWDRKIFYNNFFITDVSFWLQPHVRGWLGFLEGLRGFHKFRWGDAPVHTWTVGMFLKKNEVIEFQFAYQHQDFHLKEAQSGGSGCKTFPAA